MAMTAEAEMLQSKNCLKTEAGFPLTLTEGQYCLTYIVE